MTGSREWFDPSHRKYIKVSFSFVFSFSSRNILRVVVQVSLHVWPQHCPQKIQKKNSRASKIIRLFLNTMT